MISGRQIPPFLAVLLLGLLALPAAGASAAAGGASPDAIVLPGTPGTIVRVGNPLLSASANGVSIAVHASAMMRGLVRVSGTLPPRHARAVRIDRLDPVRGWLAATTAPVAADGSFHAVWRPARAGTTQIRAVPVTGAGGSSAGGAGAAGGSAGAASGAPQLGLTVYHPGVASWYGASGSGTTTACGVTLTRTTLGVAHRTLPCGTSVALYYRGRTLVVPVIDRGPYVHGRSWDLTLATYRALGGGSEGLLTIGALTVATPAPVPAPAAG
jgi:rare lipoprotein A